MPRLAKELSELEVKRLAGVGTACKRPVSPGQRRRLHGGASTRPKTEEGKKRILEGQKKRREWEK